MEKYLKLLTLLIFILHGYWGISNHEIWLDEAHHFVLARDSKSWSDLFYNNRYEGHPLLWNLLLWLLCKLSPTVFSMQVLHLSIASLSATILLFSSPFKLYQKVLLCFSYFLMFEYTVISRNYAIGILLIFLCLIQITNNKKNYKLILILLALLAQTHLFSLIISVCLFGYLWSSKTNRIELFQNKINYIFVFLFIGAVLFALSFAKVPSDHFLFNYNSDSLFSFKRIGKALSICWKSLFHLPPFNELNLWNKNWLIEYSKPMGSVAAILAWIIPFLFFRKQKKIMLLFYGISTGVAVFVFLSPLIVAVRHSGYIFMAFLLSYWLMVSNNNRVQNKWSECVFGLLLVPLCGASFIMLEKDFRFDFSGGKKTSHFLQHMNLKNNPEIICQNTAMPVISSYTGSAYIELNTLIKGSFCHWNNHPFLLQSNDVNVQLLKYFKEKKAKNVIYIAQDSLNLKVLNSSSVLRYKLLKSFTNCIVKQENYFIYEVIPLEFLTQINKLEMVNTFSPVE